MKIALISILSFFSLISYAEQTAKIHYFENFAQNKQKLVFKTDKSCKSNPDFIQIQEFFSEKKYASADSGKKVPVRIVHVHVNTSINNCKEIMTAPAERTFDLPKSKLMTHVYIISDPTVEIRSLQ